MSDAITESPRILNKLVDGMVGTSSAGTLAFAYQGEGWDIIPSNAGNTEMFRWRGYLDLGGMEREALTFFVQSAQVTEDTHIFSGAPGVAIVDVFSKVELTDSDLNMATLSNSILYAPGYNRSVQDMDQVLWARVRSLYHDTGWSATDLQQVFNTQIWGEGIGTSASRIHLTRYVRPFGDDSGLNIPQACFQLIGTAIEEGDLEYIMRLRRDYELATQG
jgi:hypothetical protein